VGPRLGKPGGGRATGEGRARANQTKDERERNDERPTGEATREGGREGGREGPARARETGRGGGWGEEPPSAYFQSAFRFDAARAPRRKPSSVFYPTGHSISIGHHLTIRQPPVRKIINVARFPPRHARFAPTLIIFARRPIRSAAVCGARPCGSHLRAASHEHGDHGERVLGRGHPPREDRQGRG
jgi:hypothetical protein